MSNQQANLGKDILHLCSDFPNQRLYPHLVAAIAAAGEQQFVFSAVRSDAEVERQPSKSCLQIQYSFQNIIRKHHRYLFRHKINTVREALLQVVEPRKFGLSHAHFLYSDGALALQLKQRFGLPFITAVRNTDLNLFMKLRPDLWLIAKKVLEEASAVVFLSPAYKWATLGRIGKELAKRVEPKSIVVPNGLAPSWLERHHSDHSQMSDDVVRVLYVGEFSRNKNIGSIIRAVETLRSRMKIELTVVGGRGNDEETIDGMLHLPRYSFVKRLQPVRDTEQLRQIYLQHTIFAMPSFTETFGLVYLEALSQGLPIIHSRGQGIDGYFAPETVSEGVDPHSDTSLSEAIVKLASRSGSIRKLCISEAHRFSWDSIGKTYASVYESVREGKTLENTL